MFKHKKAQGISVTTIIIAAIALVVLVVLIAVFVGKIGPWSEKIEDCTEKGGTCVANILECKQKGALNSVLTKTSCEKDSGEDRPICCIPVGEQKNENI